MTDNAPLIGRTLAGRFRITGYIGEGGMASVYRGVQDGDSRNVAIKVMAADLVKDRKFVRRFRREAKAASMLKHPNTVEILEFGVDGEIVYLAMECIEGLDLAMVLERDRRVPEQRSAAIVMQVCSALSVAHAQNIVHRDLKPDNIMITAHPKEKGAELVKVLDFGIAKILDEDEGPMPDPRAEPQSHAPSLLTRVGTIVGTPAYMSPEQGRAEKVDGRTDLYACGVLLYELVTGRTPFGGETPMQVVMRHVNEPPMPPSEWVEIHPELERIILKALMKWPAQRQQSAEELRKELEAVLPKLSAAKRPLVPPGARAAASAPAAPPPAAGRPAEAAGATPAPLGSAGAGTAAAGTAPGGPAAARPATAGAAPAGSAAAGSATSGAASSGAAPVTVATPATRPAGNAPAVDADDDEPSTLMIPDAAAAAMTTGAAAAPDKKLVFPTLNIDLPDDLEKAGVSKPSPGAAPPAASPPAPKPAPAAAKPPPDDDDDNQRTLIAPQRPPTGGGLGLQPGASPLAQTLASEVEVDAKLAQAKLESATAAMPKPTTPSLVDALEAAGAPEAKATEERADAAAPQAAKSDPGAAAAQGREQLGLAKTLPIGQTDLDKLVPRDLVAAEAAPPRPALPSLTEGLPQVPAAPSAPPKKGLSVGMAMVLGALLGALVVGGIVVALVSMR